jgi:type IV pilus assembly protein PilC
MSRAAPLPLSALIELCRSLRHYLAAGLSLVDVFRQQATRGPAALRSVAADIVANLERGHDLEYVLNRHKERFPPLLLSLASVGEQSGNLPEIFAELEKYFKLQQQLRRQFWSQITWPLIQFVLATLIIAGVLFILGMFHSNYDPLGFGLTGTSGALTFLGIVWGTVAILGLIYFLLTRSLRRRAKVHALLLRLPAVGPCLEALALGRFCLALRMTTDTAMPISRAAQLSLRATDNEAFAARTDVVVKALDKGEDLTLALARTRLLPEDFQNILANAEEGGRVSEMLRHQAEHYEEEARRRLSILTKVAGYAVWMVVAGLIIFMIFRMYLTYFAQFDKLGV